MGFIAFIMGAYDLSIGVLLVGIFVNTYLFGIVSVQFLTYYTRNFKDPIWIRLAVGVLLLIDTFHSVTVVYMAWEYCVTNFNNPGILGVALWPYTFTPIGTALAAVVTHVFLSYRIYCLSRKFWIFGLLILGALASFSTGVACGIRAWLIKDLSKLNVLTTLVTCWLIIQMVLDMVIALAMTYVLWKSKTGYRKTDSVIHRLIISAVQIGVFSTIFAAGDLISFGNNILVAPQTNFYGMFAIPLGRIYTNTLINTLNMRGGLKEILSDEVEMSGPSFSHKSSIGIQIRAQDTITAQTDRFNNFNSLNSHIRASSSGPEPAMDNTASRSGD